MVQTRTYLVCPLNWGLGHATRTIPIIQNLIAKGNRVILGGDGDALVRLREEFPDLKWILIPDIQVRFYSDKKAIQLLKFIPRLIVQYIREHFLLKKIIKEVKIDVVISDNRYGLWNKNTKSIFISHQLMIKLPKPFQWFEKVIHLIIKQNTVLFNECWIPDYQDQFDNLSGDLSHKYPIPENAKFIGPLSRFSSVKEDKEPQKEYEIIAILSGPEPARSDLETILIKTLSSIKRTALIIQGKPGHQNHIQKEKLCVYSHMSTSQLKYYLTHAKYIICRPGYTTIMDLNILQKKAIFIPTPGQTEQEYLAAHHTDKKIVISQKNIQSEFCNYIDFSYDLFKSNKC